MSDGLLTIQALDEQLTKHWASGEEVPSSSISRLIQMGLDNSPTITNIEDRQELRYILRVWAGRLRRLGHRFPDIDIDTPSRRPTSLTSRSID